MASSGSSAPSVPKDSPPPPSPDSPNGGRPAITASLTSLSVAALGVVFGDISTSPLYSFKTVLNLAGERPDSFTVLGSVSLGIWTLILVTSIKYARGVRHAHQ